MSEVKARMSGMIKAFFDKYSISGGQKIHFENTGKFQDSRLNDEYHGFWSGWMAKQEQLPKYCTPEQYKQLIGDDWPDTGPVWAISYKRGEPGTEWSLMEYEDARKWFDIMVIAGLDGKPPADYRPEPVK